MEYGLIKDTTLTNIAEALRAKKAIPATRPGTVLVDSYNIYSNVISETDKSFRSISDGGLLKPTPYSTPDDRTRVYRVSVPDATSLKMHLSFGTYATTYGNTVGYIYVYDSTGNAIPQTPGLYGHNIYAGTTINSKQDEIWTIADNSIEIKLLNCQGENFGTTIKIYALDANGEVLPELFEQEVEVVNTVTPEEIVDAVNNLGIQPPEDIFTLKGSLMYNNYQGKWDWFYTNYADKITAPNVSDLYQSFYGSDLERIPFTFYIDSSLSLSNRFLGTFEYMSYLTECPKIRGNIKMDTSFTAENMLSNCSRLIDAEDLFDSAALDDFSKIKVTSSYTTPKVYGMFKYCSSLRKIPSWFKKMTISTESTALPSQYNAPYYQGFIHCHVLDEALDFPVWGGSGTATSNMFSTFFSDCPRLKNLTFATDENGQPIKVKWKSQTIDLTKQVGFPAASTNYQGIILNISGDKEVKDDATYQALKNDPDWYVNSYSDTVRFGYARYNHDSAVNTINSLPDTSAYLASAGGTNTIKFKGAAGGLTDGGAINTLTAEEIAVAAAKGWTVTLT